MHEIKKGDQENGFAFAAQKQTLKSLGLGRRSLAGCGDSEKKGQKNRNDSVVKIYCR